jgi:hypothetical protein
MCVELWIYVRVELCVLNIAIELCVELWTYVCSYGIMCVELQIIIFYL